MVRELLVFFKNPEYKIDKELNLNNKFTILIRLAFLALIISLSLGMIIGLLENFTSIDFGRHAIDELFEEYSPGFILLAVVILAPLVEELIFRGPMYLLDEAGISK